MWVRASKKGYRTKLETARVTHHIHVVSKEPIKLRYLVQPGQPEALLEKVLNDNLFLPLPNINEEHPLRKYVIHDCDGQVLNPVDHRVASQRLRTML
jgi:hypothetical protein